jgi:hypothetical protein
VVCEAVVDDVAAAVVDVVEVVCEVVGDDVAVVVVDVVEVVDCEAPTTKLGENDCAPVESVSPRKKVWPGIANDPGVQTYEFEIRPAMQMLVIILCIVLNVFLMLKDRIRTLEFPVLLRQCWKPRCVSNILKLAKSQYSS